MRTRTKSRRARHCTAAWHRRFGARMRILRLALGLTEAQAAAAYGVTLGTYQRYEAGAPMHGGTVKLMRFCRRYPAVSLDWLLEGDARGITRELSRPSNSNVAILPVLSRAEQLRRKARALTAWHPDSEGA